LSELTIDGKLRGPALSSDGLTLYFAVESDVSPGDLYRATRADLTSPFAAPVIITELNTASAELTPHLSSTSEALYFSSDRLGNEDIWRAMPGLYGAFSPPEPMTTVNSSEADFLPCLSPDGLRLLLGSNREGASGSSDLWVATRPTLTGTFAAASPQSELNTVARDEGATLTGDDLNVFLTSDRPGGAGDLDIWYSSRYNLQSNFSPPVNVTELNSPAEESDVHVSREGNEIFFSSARTGEPRLWHATRACP